MKSISQIILIVALFNFALVLGKGKLYCGTAFIIN